MPDGLSIVDNELCAVTVIEFADSGYDSYLIFRLENRSADKNYTFLVQDFAVNGVTADAMGGEVVGPGETADSKYYINFEYVDADDIGGFTDVWMNFRVRDNDDLSAGDIASVEANMYLYGEVKPLWTGIIGPGQVGYSNMQFESSDLEEDGITDVEEIKLNLKVKA